MTSFTSHLGRATALAVFLSTGAFSVGPAAAAPKKETVIIYAPTAPPPPRAEQAPPPPPSSTMAWQAGYWQWGGSNYEWVPGRYVERPNTSLPNWVPGHWDQQPQGWMWTDGHWEG